MAPTLQDVSMLLGLPLAGEAIGPLQAPLTWRNQMEARFAGINPQNPPCPDVGHGPRVSYLSNFQVSLLLSVVHIFSTTQHYSYVFFVV